uniref:hypothetical protein n=1 Tax=Candidatus Pelagibacter sp. TaxID=2024849 RepID=UPI000A70A8FD
MTSLVLKNKNKVTTNHYDSFNLNRELKMATKKKAKKAAKKTKKKAKKAKKRKR